MPQQPLPFDPIAEARRQWDLRSPRGPAMAAATSIMRAQQLVLAAVDHALAPFELSFARYEVLVLLSFSRHGALPMGKMGDRLMVHPTSITSTVDRLEEQGLVQRARHPDDRRIVLAEITPEGRRVVGAATTRRRGRPRSGSAPTAPTTSTRSPPRSARSASPRATSPRRPPRRPPTDGYPDAPPGAASISAMVASSGARPMRTAGVASQQRGQRLRSGPAHRWCART